MDDKEMWCKAIKEMARDYTVTIVGLENKIHELELQVRDLKDRLRWEEDSEDAQ